MVILCIVDSDQAKSLLSINTSKYHPPAQSLNSPSSVFAYHAPPRSGVLEESKD